MSCYLFSLILVLFCSTIATKSTYQFSKRGVQPFASYRTLSGKWVGKLCRYEFLLVFFDYCFISFYYSYEIHLPIFETWHAAVRMIHRAVHRHRIYGCTVTVYTVSVSVPLVIEGLVIQYGGRYGVVP